MKKKNILFFIALVVFVVIILFLIFNKSKEGSLIELNISNLEAKLENKDTFILCISSTTCITKSIDTFSCKWTFDLWYCNCDSVCKYTYDAW